MTPTVRLVDASVDLLDGWQRDPQEFGRILGAPVPAGWPEFPDALPWTAQRLREHPDEAGWWMLLFLDAQTGHLVGSGGFKGPPADGAVELGYEIAPGFRRRGYATAAVLAMLDRAAAAGVEAVLAHTLPEENASVRVLRGTGFDFVGPVEEDGMAVWRWRRG